MKTQSTEVNLLKGLAWWLGGNINQGTDIMFGQNKGVDVALQ